MARRSEETAEAAAPEEAAEEMPRLRLAAAEVARERGSAFRIHIRLERGGRPFEAAAAGVGLETVELRLAADATLAAIRGACPEGPVLQLVGIKTVHAFDAVVVLVGLLDAAGGRRLVGAVAVEDTLAEAASRAVLDATNRILSRPAKGEADPAAPQDASPPA